MAPNLHSYPGPSPEDHAFVQDRVFPQALPAARAMTQDGWLVIGNGAHATRIHRQRTTAFPGIVLVAKLDPGQSTTGHEQTLVQAFPDPPPAPEIILTRTRTRPAQAPAGDPL